MGGTLGLLAGIGALAIPGVGPLIAAGPIMGGACWPGVGGAVGGLVGALVGMGIPEYEAKRYEGRIKDGGVLLSVHCDTSAEIDSAKEVLKASGAEDISSSGEKSASTHGVTDDPPSASSCRQQVLELKEAMMSFVVWIILGLVAGFVASKIVNKRGGGLILDIVLGIVGAVSGWLFVQCLRRIWRNWSKCLQLRRSCCWSDSGVSRLSRHFPAA